MKLLLVTGAGASRELGADETPLPLMSDWSNALCSALDRAENKLAQACHLQPGMSGEQFEEAIGLLLQWQDVRSLEQRFEGLGGQHPGHVAQQIHESRTRMDERLSRVIRVIRQSLYAEFGLDRVDAEKAKLAYGALLGSFDLEQLMVATTNYDRSLEGALEDLGMTVETGFKGATGRRRVLDVRGLVENAEEGGYVPLLHLHGAVGWYESNGEVREHTGDDPFNETLGTPVILYPDPRKDPTTNPHVRELWTQFHVATQLATHMLILGHSLHDPALVSAIRGASAKTAATALPADQDAAQRIKKLLPKSQALRIEFGPQPTLDGSGLGKFVSS